MSGDEKMSRRDLLRARFLKGATPAPVDDAPSPPPTPTGPVMRYPKSGEDLPAAPRSGGYRRSIPILRPPGAVDEQTFLKECTRCNACVEVCPVDAIVHAPARFREAVGTPMIDPMGEPCVMCDGLPCIASCEPGVLTDLLRPAMGMAKIVEETCLAHQGSFCTVCSERCPVEGAIVLDAGRPTVDESVCTGCGVCQYVCPAPENSVLIMPALTRPTKPEATDE